MTLLTKQERYDTIRTQSVARPLGTRIAAHAASVQQEQPIVQQEQQASAADAASAVPSSFPTEDSEYNRLLAQLSEQEQQGLQELASMVAVLYSASAEQHAMLALALRSSYGTDGTAKLLALCEAASKVW